MNANSLPASNRVGIAIVLVIVVAVASAYFFLARTPEVITPSVPVAVPAPPPVPVAKQVEVAPALAPVEAPKSAFVPAPKKIDQRITIANEFRSVKSMKAFYDKYSSPIHANDGVAAFYRAKALEECTSWNKIDPDKYASMLMPNYQSNPSPGVQARAKAIFDQAQRCAGFTEAGDQALIKATLEQARLLNDPAAVATTLASINQGGHHAEAESIARQLLQNPNPDIINGIISYLGSREGGWVLGDLGEPSVDMRRDAWRLATCSWGADCSSNYPELRHACIVQGVCNSLSYDAYLQQHQYSPADYERLQRIANHITSSVASQNWPALGLATTSSGNRK